MTIDPQPKAIANILGGSSTTLPPKTFLDDPYEGTRVVSIEGIIENGKICLLPERRKFPEGTRVIVVAPDMPKE